jgi:hypothetical protein
MEHSKGRPARSAREIVLWAFAGKDAAADDDDDGGDGGEEAPSSPSSSFPPSVFSFFLLFLGIEETSTT